jgi:PKD repeat protein
MLANARNFVLRNPSHGSSGHSSGRKRIIALLASLTLTVIGLALVAPPPAEAAQGSTPGPPNTLPSAVPSASTPNVNDGRVFGIAQVGSTMVIGGTFTQVAGQARGYVAAFNKTTGVLTSFAPTLNNYVNQVIPGPNDHTVYVAGAFTAVNGTADTFVTLLDLNTGQRVAGFNPPSFQYNEAKDIVLRSNRLYVAGSFTKVGGVSHGGLVSLNATTGAVDPFVGVAFTGHHNDSGSGAQGAVGPSDIDVTPDGSKLVAVGNFKYADGMLRNQVAIVNLTGPSAQIQADWATTRYAPYCFNWAFDQTVRGVSMSPDGSFFVVASTGGGNPGTLCDAAARFETNATGSDIQPTWIDQSGGDTLWGVTITNTAVYVGGHNRWMNNPNGVDHARAGAVPRAGLMALDLKTGRPFKWNPGRVPLGVAVFALLATDDGLWLGSDTDYIGPHKYKRQKLAFFPYTGGYQAASTQVGTIPGTIYLGSNGSSTNQLRSVAFDGTTAQPAQNLSTQGIDFNNWRGAFMVGNRVYYGYTDGYLYSRTFDGTTFGSAVQVNPYHDPDWMNVETGLGDTFDGALPSLYGQLGNVTSMFYSNGRLYYTLLNDATLRWRWFLPDSGIVDETSFNVTSSVNFSQANGIYIAGGKLDYGSRSDGLLRSATFSGGVVSGSPTVVGAGVDWRNKGAFLYNAPAPNQPPTAAFTSSCTDLNCSFDASGSSDPDGTIASYAWTFGDGQTGSGKNTTHGFPATGTYSVTLTVTDDKGATANVSHSVSVTTATSGLSFVAATDAGGGNTKTKQLTVPSQTAAGDVMVLTLAQTTTSTWTTPAGWTQVDTSTSGSLLSTLWVRTATASDPGSTVQVTSGAYSHASLNLSVYSGVSTSNPITAVAHAGDTNTATHVSPTITAASGDWLLTIWTDRSSATRTWAVPETTRDASTDSGTLTVQAVVSDSNGPVSGGTNGGLTGTTDASTGAAVMFSIALNAA